MQGSKPMNWEPDFMSLSSEDLRRYDNRSGFDLVSCQEVGLPVYKLTVNALTQIRKPIPPIEEFILKAIDAGLSSEDEIAGFLGLEFSTVREAIVSLRLSEDIDLIAPDATQLQIWKLTKKGERTLREAKKIFPEERTFEINFDGLLRIPRWYSRSERSLLTPKDLRDKGIVEIEPPSKFPPSISDLKLKDVDAIIKKIEGNRNSKNLQERDLLALKEIKCRKRFFQLATVLVYKAKDSDEIQIAFIVDGILSNDHETAFSRSTGIQKIRNKILKVLKNNEPLKFAEELLGKEFVSANLVDPDTVTLELTETKAQIEAQIEVAQEKLVQIEDEGEKDRLIQQLAEKEQQIVQLQAQMEAMLASVPIRWLEMYEHRPLLEQALKNTRERLMIISPWIRCNVVNFPFLQQLENLLEQGVRIFIGYGLGEKDEKCSPKDIDARKSLQKLADKYPKSFILKRLGDTHAKVLISDTKFAVTTSFNWLSFKGQPEREFRDERGTLVADPKKIDELFDNLVRRF